MAYIHGGTAFSLYTETKPVSSEYSKIVTRQDAIIKADATYAICFVYVRDIDGAKAYQFRSFKIGASSYKDEFKGTKTLITNTEYTYTNGHTENTQKTESLPANAQPVAARMGQDSYGTWMFSTAIPVFNSEVDFNKYFKSGDTSSSVVFTNTDWNLFIDGTKNPLYKLTWDCASVPTSDTSKVKVLFCASDNMVNDTYIVKDTHYYDYNDKSVKLNYHDICEAVWGDIGVKSPVTIIVQFEYFETTTVVPKGTSSYMYCELYPNEKNGHMYGNIGFCKVGEHSTWFVKTSSGDGSTFTAHDGTDGSDGYTKDDDKGYNDN